MPRRSPRRRAPDTERRRTARRRGARLAAHRARLLLRLRAPRHGGRADRRDRLSARAARAGQPRRPRTARDGGDAEPARAGDRGARGLGYFNFFPDADGIFRHAPLAIRYGDRVTMPLSLAMLQLYWRDRPPAIRFGAAGVESVRLGTAPSRSTRTASCWWTTAGRGRTFRHISAADVLAGASAARRSATSSCCVGVTAVGVGDVRAAPFDAVFPGVEIHATVLDNILRQDFIYRPRWLGSVHAGLADIAVIFALVLVLGLALHPLPLRGSGRRAGRAERAGRVSPRRSAAVHTHRRRAERRVSCAGDRAHVPRRSACSTTSWSIARNATRAACSICT